MTSDSQLSGAERRWWHKQKKVGFDWVVEAATAGWWGCDMESVKRG